MYWGHFLWEQCGHWSSALVSGLDRVAGGEIGSPVRSTVLEHLPKLPGVLEVRLYPNNDPCCKYEIIGHEYSLKWLLMIHYDLSANIIYICFINIKCFKIISTFQEFSWKFFIIIKQLFCSSHLNEDKVEIQVRCAYLSRTKDTK